MQLYALNSASPNPQDQQWQVLNDLFWTRAGIHGRQNLPGVAAWKLLRFTFCVSYDGVLLGYTP